MKLERRSAQGLSRLFQHVIGIAARAGDGLRWVRYRRAELLRTSPAETVPEGAPDSAFTWVPALIVRTMPRPAVRCLPRARITYNVTLPANAIVTSWCRLDPGTSGRTSDGVEFELRVSAQGLESFATCRLEPATRAGRRWRQLRLRTRAPGPARIVLITRPTGRTAVDELSALWGNPRIEWVRPLKQMLWTARTALLDRRNRGLRRRSAFVDSDSVYRLWAREHEPSRRTRRAQRKWALSGVGMPVFTLITFLEEPAHRRPGRTAETLLDQTYPGWEWLVVVADASKPDLDLPRDERVRVIHVPAGTTRAGAWNAGLREARGSFVALLDQRDRLAPAALYEMASAIERFPACDLLYSDEDRVARESGKRRDPRFKPDWSPELLLSSNYIGRLAMIRRSLATAIGGFRDFRDFHDFSHSGAGSEWDLLLRLSRSAAGVHRVPHCLYHRDDVDRSESARLQDGGNEAAVCDHWRERGVEATVSRIGDVYRSRWPVQGSSLVSIVIPNRNAAAVLAPCVSGLLERTAYPHRELILVDNGSTDPEVLDLYAALEKSGYGRIVPFDRPFNFSAACNAGAAAARGELLLFLNNDIEVIEPDWLDEMVRWAERPEIGIVGAKLLYPDRTIQHAGVAFGSGGLVDHIFSKAPEGVSGIFGTSESYRNYLAVTGACQMIRKDVFQRIGGFDERLRISFSDVVLCMEAWKAGFRVVYTPYARLVHHESYSRKRQDSTEDLELLARYLRSSGFLEDPYFHPELDPKSSLPMLRPPFEPMPGEAVRDHIDRVLSAADSLSSSVHGG